jgi:hypothetical protein
MLSQRKTYADRIKHSATSRLSWIFSIRSVRLLPCSGRVRKLQAMTSLSRNDIQCSSPCSNSSPSEAYFHRRAYE